MRRYGLIIGLAQREYTIWFDDPVTRRLFLNEMQYMLYHWQFIDQDITARVAPVGQLPEWEKPRPALSMAPQSGPWIP